MHICILEYELCKYAGSSRKRIKEKSERGSGKMNRIPLEEHMKRLRECRAGDTEYNCVAIKRFANIPIGEYMAGYEELSEVMYRLLGITKEEAEHMTYQDVAKKIDVMYQSKETRAKSFVAIRCLMKPFDYCYEERNQYYGET